MTETGSTVDDWQWRNGVRRQMAQNLLERVGHVFATEAPHSTDMLIAALALNTLVLLDGRPPDVLHSQASDEGNDD